MRASLSFARLQCIYYFIPPKLRIAWLFDNENEHVVDKTGGFCPDDTLLVLTDINRDGDAVTGEIGLLVLEILSDDLNLPRRLLQD